MSEHSIAILNKIRLASGLRQLVITSTIRTPAEQAQEMYKLTKERSEILSRLAPDKVPLDQQERNLHAAQARVMRDQKMSADSGDRNEMLNQYSLDLQQSQREYEIYDKQRAQFQSVHAKDLKALAGTVTYKGVAGSVQDVAARSIARHEPEATTIKKMLVQIDKVNYVNVTTHAGRDGLEVVDLRLPANDAQRAKLLKAIKRELGNNVYRVGYPGGPATKKPFEFADPHCFHIEIFQPIQTGKPIEKVLDPRDTNPAQAQKVHGSA